MKKLLLLTILILTRVACTAQLNLQWGDIFCNQNGGSQIHSVTIDINNQIVALGSFGGTVDFDPGIGNTATVAPGSYDNVFIARYSMAGTLIDVFVIGSNGQVRPNKIITDVSGAIYVCGDYTSSFDIDPGSQTYLVGGSSFFKGFLVKYSSAGDFEWVSTFDDSSSNVSLWQVSIDPFGFVNILGGFSGTSMDFDPGSSSYVVTNSSTSVCFLARFDTAGNFLNEWHYQNSFSAGSAVFSGVTYLSDSSTILLGNVSGSMDLDPTNGTAFTFGGQHEFLMRYISDSLVWCSLMPVLSGYGGAAVLDIDSQDNIIYAGHFDGVIDMNPGSGIDTISANQGSYDLFIASYDSMGNLNWFHDMGSDGYDEINGVAIDASGNVYVTGLYDGTMDFDPGINSAISTSTNNTNDPFIAIFSPNGTYRDHFSFGSASNVEYGTNACVTNTGVIFTGQIRGPVDYQPGANTTILGDMFAESYLISYDFAVGIADLPLATPQVYPNPMVENSTVVLPRSFEKSFVEIYDSFGRLVLSNDLSGNVFEISRNNLSPGMYSIVVTSNSEIAHARLIVE